NVAVRRQQGSAESPDAQFRRRAGRYDIDRAEPAPWLGENRHGRRRSTAGCRDEHPGAGRTGDWRRRPGRPSLHRLSGRATALVGHSRGSEKLTTTTGPAASASAPRPASARSAAGCAAAAAPWTVAAGPAVAGAGRGGTLKARRNAAPDWDARP